MKSRLLISYLYIKHRKKHAKCIGMKSTLRYWARSEVDGGYKYYLWVVRVVNIMIQVFAPFVLCKRIFTKGFTVIRDSNGGGIKVVLKVLCNFTKNLNVTHFYQNDISDNMHNHNVDFHVSYVFQFDHNYSTLKKIWEKKFLIADEFTKK